MSPDNEIADRSIDMTGKTVGDYAIIRRLGRGGMADVYLARQQSLKRNVALKILKPDLAHDASYIARFQREAQSAALLVQANIVQIHEVGEIDGLHFIAQEYVVGRNLREYVARFGAVKPVMAINVLRQVALALKKAEEFNVIHRDIKPENIMLSPGGEVKVADFGLARINDDSDKNLTQIGITMGTPLYMSPEQVEGTGVDVRSDIYSLGVTAYHMLAGKPPYDGETALAIALQHVKNEPEPLALIRPDLPAEMIHLIGRMMARSVTDRPQNASQLLKDIRNLKIEKGEDWDRLVETLAIENAITKPAIALPESRLAVTRQLQSVMKGNIRSWWTDPTTVVTFVLLTAMGSLAGMWLANTYPVQNPLNSVALGEMGIPKKSSAKEQYEYAVNWHPNDERYYQAVIDYFPVDGSTELQNQTRLHVGRARERLAEIHLLNENWEAAEEIYHELAAAEGQERLNVVGHAGLVVVYDHLGDSILVRTELAEIDESQIALLNEFLRVRFSMIRERHMHNLSSGITHSENQS